MVTKNIIIVLLFVVLVIILLPNNEIAEKFEQNTKQYRRIIFKETPFYFLTLNNPTRKKHILDEFKQFNPIEVNPMTGKEIQRFQSGATGFGKMIDRGLSAQDRTKPFQPFILLEDDSSIMRPFPESIDIPLDTDILYLGLHGWGYATDKPIPIVYSEHIDQHLMRVRNLLATHAIMVCSSLGASVMQRCMMESYHLNLPWDVPLTNAQPYYNVYALKNPLVYQDAKYGGKEEATRIVARDHWFVPMPDHLIHRTRSSVLFAQK
jgi:hypothetical protein